MKKHLILLLSVLLISCVTYVPVTMQSIDRTIIVEGNKDDLFVKANNWMAETFISSKSVIQYSDKEAGVVTGRYLFKDFGSGGEVYAIIKLQVKNGATKITIDSQDFNEVHSSLNESYRYTKEKAIQDVNALIDDYEYYLKNTDNSF